VRYLGSQTSYVGPPPAAPSPAAPIVSLVTDINPLMFLSLNFTHYLDQGIRSVSIRRWGGYVPWTASHLITAVDQRFGWPVRPGDPVITGRPRSEGRLPITAKAVTPCPLNTNSR